MTAVRSLLHVRAINARDDAVAKAGGPTKLAAALSAIGAPITKQGVCRWKIIPEARVLDVERVTSLHRSALRPDLYPDENTRQRA